MAKKKQEFYTYHNTPDTNFAMVTLDLLQSEVFQSLSYAARYFYVVLLAQKKNPEQTTCLYNTLKEYRDILSENWTDADLRGMSGQDKRWRGGRSFFVIPEKQLKLYGYSSQYANKLKMDVKALQNVMGHSDAGITMNIYNHSTFERTEKEIHRIDNVINF